MPGTGHSSRHKGSITGRSSKSAFQALAPWNSRKNGNVNQVPVSSGGGPLNFKLMNAKMMSNYDKNKDEFILDCSLNVKGNKTVNGTTKMNGDVDCCGNVTIAGQLIAPNAIITDLSVNKLVDVCDNVLTLGNHLVSTTNHLRGLFMKTENNTTGQKDHAFMGYDPSGTPDVSSCLYGTTNDSHGTFVFLTSYGYGATDLSFNPFAPSNGCNIFGGDLGRVAMGTLDISGSERYGDAGPGVGVPTKGVTGQNDCSMHLVGKTIIARKAGASKPLDISGGIYIVDNSGATFDMSNDTVKINNKNIDIDATSGIDICGNGACLKLNTNGATLMSSGNAINIGGGVNSVDISGTTNVKLSDGSGVHINIASGLIHLDVSSNSQPGMGQDKGQIKLSDGNGAYIDISGGKIDISGDDVSITGSSGSSLHLKGPKISIGQAGGTVDLSGTVKFSEGSTVNGITIDASGITLDGFAGAPSDPSWNVQSSIATGYGFTKHANCGRIVITTDSTGLVAGTAPYTLQMDNNYIKANSIILLTPEYGNTGGFGGALNPFNLQFSLIEVIDGSCKVRMSLPQVLSSSLVIGLADGVRLHFMIINPTSS